MILTGEAYFFIMTYLIYAYDEESFGDRGMRIYW